MSPASITRSVARILKAHGPKAGQPAGVGILVPRGCVVTCAHVVTDALGLDRSHSSAPDPPKLPVTLDFLEDPKKAPHSATVLAGGWYPAPPDGAPRDEDQSTSDVAVLQIDRDAPPETAPVSRIGSAESGQAFECWGAPDPGGGTATGIVRNIFSNMRFQLDLQRYRNSQFNTIRSGFSGGGVWSGGSLVGMVVAASDQNAEMISSSSLSRLCPSLADASRSTGFTLRHLIDREDEIRRMVKAMDGGAGGFVSVGFHGDPRAGFKFLIERLQAGRYLLDSQPAVPPEHFIRLNWKPRFEELADGLIRELSGRRPSNLASEQIPAQIADQLNTLETPMAIHLRVIPGGFGAEGRDCLRRWMEMWREIAPLLEVPVVHLVFFARLQKPADVPPALPPEAQPRPSFLRRLLGGSDRRAPFAAQVADFFDDAWEQHRKTAGDCIPLDRVDPDAALESWLDGPVKLHHPGFCDGATTIAQVRSHLMSQPNGDGFEDGLAHLEDILRAPVLLRF